MATTSRSDIMRAVRATDTGPERLVRALLRRFAPGYRLHRADLPGKPDIAYLGLRRAIFVHGCFWHGHDCPRGAREPKTNVIYWRAKIARNRSRDADHERALDARGWRVLTIWECETKDRAALEARLHAFLATEAESIKRPSSKRR